MTDTVLRFDEGSHHAGPCACQVVTIVAATAGTDDAALAVLFSQTAQRRRCMSVGLFRPAEVRDRITFKTVSTALHEDELGLPGINVCLDPVPGLIKLLVIRTSCNRNIELRAFCPALARLVRMAGTRVEHASVLVDVSKNQVRIVLKAIENTVTVVRVDIDIGDALEAECLAQVLDGDSAVVENAETGSPVTCRMMQTRNRHERTLVVTMHDLVDGAENSANDSRCSVINTFDSRCIAFIEPALSDGRHAGDLVDILGGVEQRQFVYERRTWMPEVDDIGQAFPFQFRMKDIVAVNAKRVWIAEPIGGNLLSFVNQHRLAHEKRPSICLCRSIPDNARFSTYGPVMAQYIYTMNRVAKVVPPKRHIIRDISLSFFPGAKIGVLGLNGSGKSTLMRIMAGLDTEIDGEARPQPGIKIGYLPQEPELDADKDVRGNVEEGLGETIDLLHRFNEISEKFAEPMSDDEMTALLDEQGKLQDAIDAAGGWEVDRKLEVAADALRLPPWDADVTKLSGGERRRVALCRLLLSQPDMLLLDEPTNHLDAESVAWLERFLDEYPSTVIAVTHDRYFLDNVAGWILELDRGHGIPWEGNYSSWLEQKEARLQNEEATEKARQRAMQHELEWVRSNPKGRQAKSKARLKQFEELSSPSYQARLETNEIYIPPGPRLGDVVLEVEDLRKGFGDKLLIDGLSFQLPAGGIVGVIGPNGAGKTTMTRMITGQEQPDSGSLRLGETVQIASVDQSRDSLDDSKSVWEEISDGLDLIKVGNYETSSRAYVGRFNFRGQDQQKKIGVLSGGERNRVHLAKMLKAGGNFLLLDEPTNDLDVETLRALEEALLEFPGSAMVISHDRWFLDRIATHILAFEGNSEVVWFAGNYADYEEDRKRRLGADAANPHRIKYKKLGA